MGLNWNEIKSRALLFSKTWADGCNEKSQSIPFWIDFFDIFGIPNKRVATFEHNVKKLSGAQGFVDLFWPGKLLVEQKSLGKDLDQAHDQAMDYLHGIEDHELPELVVVCDFGRFQLRRLATGEVLHFKLSELHMPPALLKAHQKLDTAVDAAYQPSGGKKTYASDAERVAFLFEHYQRITSLLTAQAAKRKSSNGKISDF